MLYVYNKFTTNQMLKAKQRQFICKRSQNTENLYVISTTLTCRDNVGLQHVVQFGVQQ